MDWSNDNWTVVAEYETDKLALDSDDEKKIGRAEKEAERKWLKKREADGQKHARDPSSLRASVPHITLDAGRSVSRKIGPCYGCGEWVVCTVTILDFPPPLNPKWCYTIYTGFQKSGEEAGQRQQICKHHEFYHKLCYIVLAESVVFIQSMVFSSHSDVFSPEVVWASHL